jgi:hypothetical protein
MDGLDDSVSGKVKAAAYTEDTRRNSSLRERTQFTEALAQEILLTHLVCFCGICMRCKPPATTWMAFGEKYHREVIWSVERGSEARDQIRSR